MTTIASPIEGPILRSVPTVTDNELPLSGFHAAATKRASSQTLEVFDPTGQLLAVVSNSPLDRSLIRGSWRGVRDGRSWGLVVGRSVGGPMTVTFGGGSRSGRRRIDVAPDPRAEFWFAEAALVSTRVAVTVAGLPAGQARLRRVPAFSTADS